MEDENSPTFSEFLLAIRRSGTSDGLYGVLLRLAGYIGAERWVYIHEPPFGSDPERDPLAVAYDNFDFDFAQRYARSHLWNRAASIRKAMVDGEAFWVDAGMDFIREFGDHPMSDEALETFKELAGFSGDRNVLCFGVFGPNGRVGYFSFWFPKGSERLARDRVLRLHMLGQKAHIRYCNLRRKEGTSEMADLTEREATMLAIAAKVGPVTKAVANEMDVSEGAVRVLIRTAGAKLHIPGENLRACMLKAAALGQLRRMDARDERIVIKNRNGDMVLHNSRHD